MLFPLLETLIYCFYTLLDMLLPALTKFVLLYALFTPEVCLLLLKSLPRPSAPLGKTPAAFLPN
jgi:hypothetical protein